jgi:hypothetical protein
MTPRGGSEGHLLAVLGAALLIVGLWLLWYTVQIPASVLGQAEQIASQYSGAFAQQFQQAAALLSALGPIHGTAWQVYTTVPALLLTIGVAAGGLSLLTIAGRADRVGPIVTLVGLPAVLLVGYRIVSRPGDSEYVHLAYGMYVSLAGAAIVLTGGLMAASGERLAPAAATGRRIDMSVHHLPPDIAPPPDPNWMRKQSVPPPDESQRPI